MNQPFRTFWGEHEPLFKHKITVLSVFDDVDVVQYAVGGSFPQWAVKYANLIVSGSVDVKYVEGISLGEVSIDFIEEKSFYIGQFYGKWMSQLTVDGRTFGYPSSYKKSLIVGLSENLQLIYEGAFPISIGAAEMSAKAAVLIRRITFSVDRVSLDERS